MKKIRRLLVAGALVLGTGLGASTAVLAAEEDPVYCYNECMASWGSVYFCAAYCKYYG